MFDKVKSLISTPIGMFSLGSIVGSAVSGGVVYILGRRERSSTEELLDEYIVANNEYVIELDRCYREKQQMDVTFGQLTNAVQELKDMGIDMLRAVKPDDEEEVVTHELVAAYSGEVVSTFTEVEATNDTLELDGVLVSRNIFDNGDDDEWDYDLERQNRHAEEPYILHKDEFDAEEFDFDQVTVTWYETDEILTDDKDVPIYNPHTVVGELRFGHGSGDNNVLYVRNERLKAEYEVLREPGSYEVIVLGGTSDIEDEFEKSDLRHSKQPLRFRSD